MIPVKRLDANIILRKIYVNAPKWAGIADPLLNRESGVVSVMGAIDLADGQLNPRTVTPMAFTPQNATCREGDSADYDAVLSNERGS